MFENNVHKNGNSGVEMAHWVSTAIAVLLLAPTLGASQLPLIPAPENLMPSFGPHGHQTHQNYT